MTATRIQRTVVTLILALLLATGASFAQGLEYAGSQYIISAEELSSLIGSENVRIYDFQRYDSYVNGHVPGAMHFDTTLLVTDEQFDYEFLGVENAVDLFSAAGISNDHTVILYWGHDRADATYAFWALHFLGHENVRILNGGIDAWKAAGYELASGDEVYPVATFTPNPYSERYATLDWVKENLQNENYHFVDARGRAAYESAHLPVKNDLHLPAGDAFDSNGLLKAPDELSQVLTSAGLLPDQEIVAYCTRGRLASQLYWVLAVAGYENISNFEASMMGWNHAGLPVATVASAQ